MTLIFSFRIEKTQMGIGCERIYSQCLRNFETTQHVCQVFVGYYFSFGIESRKKNLSTNKKEKKKRPDERNTRIIMPRKRNMGFSSYVRHFPSKSFLKKGDYTMKTLQLCTSTKEISFFC